MGFRRPSLASRAQSSPLTPKNISNPARDCSNQPMRNVLTPPTSPRHTRSSTDLTKTDSIRSSLDNEIPPQMIENGILICPFDVEISRDGRDRHQIFGHGAWSTVYKGICRSKMSQTSGLATPPPSPMPRPPIFVAVKQPARKDAIAILSSEARILSRLMSIPNHELHITTFYGMLPEISSLVLAAHPLSLEQHINGCATSARATLSTSNMFTPVIGSTDIWLDLSYQLISTLDWLHTHAHIVHGDIKPGNILLQPINTNSQNEFPYQALFVDFSSSQRLDTHDITPNTLSAVTQEYTAPELLSSKVLSDPSTIATTASDVFSLAVTLLVAATGVTMVYSGSVFQRRTLATQGWQVIDFARNGDQGSRVPRHGVVSRALERAVLKKDMGRISAERWRDLVETIANSEEPSKL